MPQGHFALCRAAQRRRRHSELADMLFRAMSLRCLCLTYVNGAKHAGDTDQGGCRLLAFACAVLKASAAAALELGNAERCQGSFD